MLVLISYEFDPKYNNYCFAKASLDGKRLLGCGKTWEDAKENLIIEIRKYEGLKRELSATPFPEEVEVDVEPTPKPTLDPEEVAHVSR